MFHRTCSYCVLISLLLFVTISTGLSRPCNASNQTRKPNIIFILADDLGYGDLACYGQKLIKTPNLDRMAAEGMRFTNFYAGCAVCAPSRCSLMTGYHTGHSYIRTNTGLPPDKPLRKEDITIAEVLKDANYSTALIGKWHLGSIDSTGSPNRQGFDYFLGFDAGGPVSRDSYFPETICQNEQVIPVAPGTYQPDLLMHEALSFIDKNKDRPFFLYLAPMLPHAPYEIPSMGHYKHQRWSKDDRRFAAMVSYLDTGVGQIIDRLKELGVDDNTIVMFSSDNGPESKTRFQSAGPLNGLKRDLYEGGIRMPFIARWPGTITPGQVVSEPFAFWDVIQTASELAGLGHQPGDGTSFLSTLLGETQNLSRSLYWEFQIKNGKGFMQAVRLGNWKGLQIETFKDGQIENTRFELYDLSVDLSEDHDVAGEHPEIVEQIRSIIEREHVEPVV